MTSEFSSWLAEGHPATISFNQEWTIVGDEPWPMMQFMFALLHDSTGSSFFLTCEGVFRFNRDQRDSVDAIEYAEDQYLPRIFDSDENAEVLERFTQTIGGTSFNFTRLSFSNPKFGQQYVDYGYSYLGDYLLMIGYAWCIELSLTGGAQRPAILEALSDGIKLAYTPDWVVGNLEDNRESEPLGDLSSVLAGSGSSLEESRDVLAKRAIKASLQADAKSFDDVTMFVEHHLAELDRSYWIEQLETASPTPEKVLHLLELKSTWHQFVEEDEQPDTFDFTLPGDVTQYIICVLFNEKGTVEKIDMQS